MALIIEQFDIESFRNGDRNTFTQVFSAYNESIFKLCLFALNRNSHDAEDLMIEIFAKFYEKSKSVKSAAHLENLLYQIARAMVANALKKKGRQKIKTIGLADNDDDLPVELHGNLLHERILLESAELAQAWWAVAIKERKNVPLQCIEVFRMYVLEKKKQAEIATMLNISVSAVKNHIAYARKLLSKALRDNGFASLRSVLGCFFLFFLK